MVRKVIIDTDAGVDDSAAIILALMDPHVEVVAITTCFGNSSLDHVNINVAKILEYTGNEHVPMYSGCDSPIVQPRTEPHWPGHGKDGLGDIPWLPAPTKVPENERAADAIVRMLEEGDGSISIVVLGPMTNIALAMKLLPRFYDFVDRLVVMGGTMWGKGNTGKGAEFNFHQDPEAVCIALQHSTPEKFVMVPWEATLDQSPLGWEIFDTLPEGPGEDLRLARLLRGLCMPQHLLFREHEELTLCDPVSMLAFLEPDGMIEESRQLHCEIELAGTIARGTVLFDWYKYQPHFTPNVTLVTKVRREFFLQVMKAIFTHEEPDTSVFTTTE